MSDGEDNNSRHSLSEVYKYVRKSDVTIYAITGQGQLGYGQYALQNLASITGGKVYYTESYSNLGYLMKLIQTELHNQYRLRYTPTSKKHDEKWHKIRVELKVRKATPKLSVRAREGYYGPSSEQIGHQAD